MDSSYEDDTPAPQKLQTLHAQGAQFPIRDRLNAICAIGLADVIFTDPEMLPFKGKRVVVWGQLVYP